MADLSFIPWLRRGLGTGLPAAGPQDADRTLSITLATNVTPVTVDVPIVGPGDIVGLDPRVVVRVVPGRDESEAEFDQFPAIELDPVDLPWRYSPTAAAPPPAPGADRLQPWLVLVVLKDDEIVQLDHARVDRKLALLTVSQSSLPDLTRSWAWAHVQAVGTATQATVQSALGGAPGRLVGRIVCPRVLEPRTAYNAFVVPSFRRGLIAGAGQNPGSTPALRAAWDANASGNVTLPVYYQWRFLTGVVSGFEDLVKRIQPRDLPQSIGGRRMDVSVPGLNLPSAAPVATPPAARDTALEVEGALQSLRRCALAPAVVGQSFVDDLKGLLNLGTVNFQGTGPIKVVLPPLGRWPAGETALEASTNPPWFAQLNRDPREQAGGGMGKTVIQANQQGLLAGAWDQVGNMRKVERRAKGPAGWARGAPACFRRHVTTSPTGDLPAPLRAAARLLQVDSLSGSSDTSPSSPRAARGAIC